MRLMWGLSLSCLIHWKITNKLPNKFCLPEENLQFPRTRAVWWPSSCRSCPGSSLIYSWHWRFPKTWWWFVTAVNCSQSCFRCLLLSLCWGLLESLLQDTVCTGRCWGQWLVILALRLLSSCSASLSEPTSFSSSSLVLLCLVCLLESSGVCSGGCSEFWPCNR